LATHTARSAIRRGGPLTGLLAEIPELGGLAVRRIFAEFGIGHTAGAALLIVDGLGRLLLVRSRHRRSFSPPGGFLRPHEPPGAAIMRELHEETGLRLDAPPLLFTTVSGPGRRHETHVFIAALTEPGPDAASDRAWEIVDVRWMTPSDQPDIHPSLAWMIDGSDPSSAVAIDAVSNRYLVRPGHLDRPRRMRCN
jgi:8-oxo-dGTP diphosphatase